MNLAFLLLISFLISSSAQASTCESAVGHCDYYTCLAENLKCAPDAVVATVAGPYCKGFEANLSRHTEIGKTVLTDIKYCLQQKIERVNPLTCQDADAVFIDAHVSCYREVGYCNLGFKDRFQLAKIAWPALEDRRFQEALVRIEFACALQIKFKEPALQSPISGGGGGWQFVLPPSTFNH